MWTQLHTNETGWHQTQLITAIINIIDENDGVFKSICLLSLIIAEDGTADEQSLKYALVGERIGGWNVY